MLFCVYAIPWIYNKIEICSLSQVYKYFFFIIFITIFNDYRTTPDSKSRLGIRKKKKRTRVKSKKANVYKNPK